MIRKKILAPFLASLFLATAHAKADDLQDAKSHVSYLLHSPEVSLGHQQIVAEFVRAEWLAGQIGPNSVSLVVNDPGSKISEEYARYVRELVKGLAEKGVQIVYDGDSKLSSVIADAAGEFGMGIVGNPKNMTLYTGPYKGLLFKNELLRMLALSNASAVIADPYSLAGMGLYADKRVDFVLDPENKFNNDYKKWMESAKPDLGLSYLNEAKVVKKWEGLATLPELVDQKIKVRQTIHVKVTPFFTAIPKFDSQRQSEWIAQADVYALSRVAESAHILSDGLHQLSKAPNGAVVFGSAKNEKQFTNLVYQSGKVLGERGVTIKTGGAEGFMEVANAGAFDAGAASIGIPIGAGDQILEKEKFFPTERHTATLITNGYQTRIPLLLWKTNLVQFVPGGNGTITELAATLVKMNAGDIEVPRLVFSSRQYYGGLHTWLMELPLPRGTHHAFRLIDSAKELVSISKEIESALGVNQGKYRSLETVTPRNDNNEYKSLEKKDKNKNKGKEKKQEKKPEAKPEKPSVNKVFEKLKEKVVKMIAQERMVRTVFDGNLGQRLMVSASSTLDPTYRAWLDSIRKRLEKEEDTSKHYDMVWKSLMYSFSADTFWNRIRDKKRYERYLSLLGADSVRIGDYINAGFIPQKYLYVLVHDTYSNLGMTPPDIMHHLDGIENFQDTMHKINEADLHFLRRATEVRMRVFK